MARRRRRADGGGFSLTRILDNPKTMTYVGIGAAALIAFIWWKNRQKAAGAAPSAGGGVGSIWEQATPAQRQAAMAAARRAAGLPPQGPASVPVSGPSNGGAAAVTQDIGASIAESEGMGVLGCDACDKGDDMTAAGSGASMDSMYD